MQGALLVRASASAVRLLRHEAGAPGHAWRRQSPATRGLGAVAPVGAARRPCPPVEQHRLVLPRSARFFHQQAAVRHQHGAPVRLPQADGGGGAEDDANFQEAQNATYLGLGKNVVLTVGKGVVGVSANSAALIADAVHSLSDIVADLVALATLRVSRLPANRCLSDPGHAASYPVEALCPGLSLRAEHLGSIVSLWQSSHQAPARAKVRAGASRVQVFADCPFVPRKHPYGHGKYEPIGALCVSSMLVGAGGGLAWHSLVLIQNMEAVAVPGVAALWISVAAIGLNEALFHITLRAGKKSRSQTVIANAWHHRSDALSSVVAMAGIGGAMVGFPMLDPLAGGAVGLMIAKTGGEMVWESVRDLTDSQDEEVLQALEATIGAVPGVASCKHVRHRRMGPYQVVDAHVFVHQELSVSAASQVVARCRAAVRAEMPDVTEMMVHVSPALDTRWSRRAGGADKEPERELEGLRSHHEIETDVRGVLSGVRDVKWIEHVHVHYIGGHVQVRCSIVLDDALRIREANLIAREVRQKIESEIADVSAADIHLELEDNCWGQCGQSLGPTCAVAEKLQRRPAGVAPKPPAAKAAL